MPRILLIDDESTLALAFKTLFEKKEYDFLSAGTGKEGLRLALKELPDLVLLDLYLPDMHGFDLLRELKAVDPEIFVIVITGMGEVKEAVQAMKLGAVHFFQKPVDLEELSIMVDKNLSFVKLREQARLCMKSGYPMIGISRHALQMDRILSLMAHNPSATVLIQGETGTGKELAARKIHFESERAGRPFVDINCASIPDNVFESELFGYEQGAFTDARGTKRGLLEVAEGGTLFLDEVGELPMPLQPKLLRVLETRSFRRLGGTRDIRVDVRVVAATNKDLPEMVRKSAFREDLFYRLNVLPVTLAPLRERPDDIPVLAEYFIGEISRSMSRRCFELDEEALAALGSYPWPGNIRELKNVIERALILCPDGRIGARDLLLPSGGETGRPFCATLEEVERQHIIKVLSSTGNNRSRAARVLGISRSTLGDKLRKYNLN